MKIQHFFDKRTWTLTYVVWDESTRDAIVIDPVLDYDPAGSQFFYDSIEEVSDFVSSNNLVLHYVLETHAHADHLSGSQELKKRFPNAILAINDQITEVQEVFKGVFNLAKSFNTDGSQFDKLLADGEEFNAGTLTIKVIHTPGHTPACSSFLVGDALFTGDALFMPDYGTGRCDFPKGDAKDLYHSIHGKLYALPDTTRVFVGHDYQPNGRELRFESTIGEQKDKNIQLRFETSEEEFVRFRTERDAKLKAPALLFPSVEVNIDAGTLPAAEDNGMRYLKIPLRERGA